MRLPETATEPATAMESPRLLGLLPLVFLSCSSLTEAADPPTAPLAARQDAADAPPALPTTEGPLRGQGDPDAVVEQAKAAIDRGELELARDLLNGLLVDRYVERARALLREDAPQEALVWLDEALVLSPEDTEVLVLHGEGSLATGERLGDALFFEDALRSFEEAGSDPQALLGASRAARMLFRTDEALRYAEAGTSALESAERSMLLPEAPERTLAQASFDAYIAAKSAAASDEDPAAAEARAAELFTKTEEALTRLMPRQGEDPWVWTNLSNLYLWENRLLDARQAIERGLETLPANPELLERLYQVSRQEGGDTAVIEAFDEYRARHAEIALGWWYGARARFDRAVDNLTDSPADELRQAGEMFARCRELQPAFETDCLGYEVMVQNGLGWCAYHAEDLAGAEAAFKACEDVLPQGLLWTIEGRLPSAVDGLFFVANAHNEAERFGAAADVFDFLREYQPEEGTWANNAGFFNRDAGTQDEALAAAFRRAAAGEVDDAELLGALRERAGVGAEDVGTEREAELLTAAAAQQDARAEERYRRSYAAYLRASELLPDDVRVVNDTALIQVYHLRDDLAKAEELLLRCVEMGAEQLQQPGLDEDQVFELENAWGDAYQNLGVLYLEVEDDPARALPFFEKCVEIGPEPRPQVTMEYLPRCRALIAERGGAAEAPAEPGSPAEGEPKPPAGNGEAGPPEGGDEGGEGS